MMVEKQRNEYLALRRKFEPARITLVILAESPPASDKYLYNPDGKVSEPLFNALMKQLGIQTNTKADGLRELQERGWVLVDATYDQVDQHREALRNHAILRDCVILCDDLKRLLGTQWREVPLVLIKNNVCQLLEPKLKETGFKVLNKGRTICFPSTGRQGDFYEQFREIVPQNLRGSGP
jgi:hypothetical protein